MALVSSDAVLWTEVAVPTIGELASIAFGAGRFVAVGDQGTILSSVDGVTWSVHSLEFDQMFTVVKYCGSRFVAVGSGGSVAISTDGLKWVIVTSADGASAHSQTSGVDMALSDVAFLNGQFVAVGDCGTVLRSTDGLSWSGQSWTSGITTQIRSVTYGDGLYVGVGLDGTTIASTDAINWTSHEPAAFNFLSDVVYAGGEFVAVAGTSVLISPDGVNWTTVPVSSLSVALLGAFSDAERIYLYGFNGILMTLPVKGASPVSPTQVTLALQIGNAEMARHTGGRTFIETLQAVPEIVQERTFLPVRAVVEALGGTVSWEDSERRVDIVKGDRSIALWIGRSDAVVDGVTVPIDVSNAEVKPFLSESGRTMLPLRFIVERLGATVDWNPDTQGIVITSGAQ